MIRSSRPLHGASLAFQINEAVQEIDFLRMNPHPRIVILEAVGTQMVNGSLAPLLVCEEFVGGSLDDWLRSPMPLPEAPLGFIAREVCEALNHVHQVNFIHRCLRPECIKLVGPGGHIKLAGFGSVCAVANANDPFNSLIYMAPEMRAGPYSFEVDLFALGCILLQCMAGDANGDITLLEPGGDPQPQVALLPMAGFPDLSPIVANLLDANPANRHTAAQCQAALVAAGF